MFLHPEALWLLAAAPLPVLLHLLGLTRPRQLVFPGVYLLRQMEARRRALRLRHLLLLALRVLAIALVALLCAGPRMLRPLPLLSAAGRPLVLVDDSASMGGGGGAAWHQARDFVTDFTASHPSARVVLVPQVSGKAGGASEASGVAGTLAAEPSPLEGALADAAANLRQTGAVDQGDAVIAVTDLDAGSVLRRAWPPEPAGGPVTVVACEPPRPGIYEARPRPTDPPPSAPTRLTCYLPAASAASLVRASASGQTSAAGQTLAAAARAAGARAVDLDLGSFTPGERLLALTAEKPAKGGTAGASSDASSGASPVRSAVPYHLALRVREPVPVCVVVGAASAPYLRAAVDPTGSGKPFSLVSGLSGAIIAVASGDVAPPAGATLKPGASLLLFAGPHAADWLRLAGTAGGEVTMSAPAADLLPDRAERLVVGTDAPPEWRASLTDFASVMRDARVLRPWTVQGGADWLPLARWSMGRPGLLWSEAGGREVLIVGFPPTPAGADVVATGAFAALMQCWLTDLLPPAGDVPPSSVAVATAQPAASGAGAAWATNPPPAELAGVVATRDEVRASWGASTKIVDYKRGMALPLGRGASDLVPLLALLLLLVVGAEWLLSGRLSEGT